jgi:hypothetical protein
VPVAVTAVFGKVFESGDFAATAGWLAESTEGAKTVTEYIRRLSPPAV